MAYIISPEKYTYEQMLDDLLVLKKQYSFIEISQIGKSVCGKTIPAVKLGIGPKKILYNASHHAREWITTPLLMKFLESYCLSIVTGKPLFRYDIPSIYNGCTIWLIPMVNPDGVNLAIKGLFEDSPHYFELLEMNKKDRDFSSWKANIRGVDLNRNYNAGWQEYKSLEPSLGIPGPSPSGYSGPHPESEPETHGLAAFTRWLNPDMVLAFHAQGEEIFWDYRGIAPSKSKMIAEALSDVSGYRLSEPDEPGALYAGYKDWFIKEFRRPGFTIEVGRDTTPVPLSQFDEICDKNFKIILRAVTID